MDKTQILKVKKKLENIKAKELMSKFAITIRPDETLINAAHLMMRFKISGLPVVSREDEIQGIITATDLFRVMGNLSESLSGENEETEKARLKVKDIMTKDVCIIGEQTSLYEIIKIMHEKNIHTLPIVSGREILGVIGRRDVLNNFYNLLEPDESN